MSRTLKKLTLDRIDVVDKGANQHSAILIAKRDTPKEPTMTDAEKLAEEKKKQAAEEAAETKKRAEQETAISKALADVAIAKAEAAEAKAEVLKMQGENERRTYIAKAADLKHYGPADALWQDLRDIAKALGPERFAKHEQRLRAVSKQVDEGKLFAEVGREGYGDTLSPMQEIEKRVGERIQKSNGALTKEAAMTAFLQTPEGQELYARHTQTMPGYQPGSGREE